MRGGGLFIDADAGTGGGEGFQPLHQFHAAVERFGDRPDDLGDAGQTLREACFKALGIDKEHGTPLARHQREGAQDRQVRHIAGTDVEQPVERGTLGNHQRIGLVGGNAGL